MEKLIRIGTRGSKLALWQAHFVADLIKASGYRTQIIPIETRGDKMLNVSIARIGSKGVFTEEIEQALLDGGIDIAVHSAKDLASEMADELELVAFTEREAANDVVVGFDKSISLSRKNLRAGTSSTRRVAFLKHFYPGAEAVSVRGNLQTRIEKLRAGFCDVLLLAYAGVHRLGYDDLIIERLDTSYFVPPVGQGSIAVQCHKKLTFDKKEVVERWVNHPATETCIRAERAFLRTLEGGCSIPSFGYASIDGNSITLKAGIISLNGHHVVKIKKSGPADDAKALGKAVAIEVLANGGAEILHEIKKGVNH